MTRNAAYQRAEQKIREALYMGDTFLDLRGVKKQDSVDEIPESIGKLTQLTHLDLSHNQLKMLPKSLGELEQLTQLNLNNNDLTTLPESISKFTQLTVMKLANNQLTALPEQLGLLSQLEFLDVQGNQLFALPASLGNLTRLNYLELSYNKLETLPESLGQLKELKELRLEANQLTTLPTSLGELTNLKELRVHRNRLTILPEALGQLRQLTELRLDSNQLATLPKSLWQLSNLWFLDATDNQIVDLPPLHVRLSRLEILRLTENPLNPELAAAYKEGLAAVERYLRAKAVGEQVVLNEAKLILIGEGEVGKSCLLGALRRDPWQAGRPTTHGIEIKSVPVVDPTTHTKITLNGWDFGGQRVYRPTHQLFFSAPAVYLVVWKPREGPQQGFVKEWIKLVKHREPDAKIIVVATHGGPATRQPDIDRQEIWDLFGHDTVIRFFHVQSEPPTTGQDGAGIADLRASIARVAAGLPEMGRAVPKHWDEARKALAATNEPYLPLHKVFAILRDHQINDDEDSRLLLRICRAVGDLIYFEHDPLLKDIVILKPDWLATAISYVLDDEETRRAHGLVSSERLSQLWNDVKRPEVERYPHELHQIFLRLMERFDISYRVAEPDREGRQRTSLIAQLVDDVRPNIAEVWTEEPSPGDDEQVQICRIVEEDRGQSANAEGLFYLLIVRFHKYSLGRADFGNSVHWQRGLVLEDDTGSRALLEHVANDVRITVRSPYPERLLSALTLEVQYLVETFWKGMKCDVTVPCPTMREGSRCAGLFIVEDLIQDLRDAREEQKCSVCKKWINIERLLRNAPEARPPQAEVLAHSAEVLQALELVRQQDIAQHAQVIGRLDNLDATTKRIVSQVEAAYTGLIRTMLDEAKEGPRLFSFEPVERSVFDPNGWVKKKFKITLWCEHARVPLRLLAPGMGEYEFEVPRDWVMQAAPFLKALTGTLSLVLPVASSALPIKIPEDTYKELENQLNFGKDCLDSVLQGMEKTIEWSEEDGGPVLSAGRGKEPTRATDGVLRTLQSWIKDTDPSFGGLVRVQNRRHEFLWVHPQYEGEY